VISSLHATFVNRERWQQAKNKMVKQSQMRLAIIAFLIIGLISFLSQTVTVLAYGVGESPFLYLLLYLLLFVSLILVFAKVKIGYFLTLFTSVGYSILLTDEVGKFLTFDSSNSILILVLLVPFLTFLLLIPLSITYLTSKTHYKIYWQSASVLFAVGFFIFIFFDRMDKNYSRMVFLDAKLENNGAVQLKVKPGFADSREFYLKTNSKELEELIREKGEFIQGSYFFTNTRIEMNFNFDELRSVTITELNKESELPDLTWKVDEINGDYEFIRP
jgi:glucan phosphoethanolaminetransferase (alkaline phosphatase superfamily)